MANVLNRQTLLYLDSVNTPDYDPSEWLINPDLSEVEDVPKHYWKITEDDQVVAMTQDEQANSDLLSIYQGLDLVGAVRVKHDLVNTFRDEKLNGGWLYQGIHYDSDVVSRSNMTGIMTLISTGYTLPAEFTFRAQNNTDVHFDNATFTAFYQCSCVWAEMIYRTSWYHKAQIKALTSIQDVAMYNYALGWPEGFSGQ
ncbi:MAG: DUF4376 domain-containing protein [Verrucomicrobiaceae bacterium]|nr:MAG: DUF4376 domain-containing protein [Verrucomicrobiaceae bacterium]